MRYMLYICLLVIPIFFFTGCREGERVIEYGQLWNAEFTVKNEASQKVSLILTPYFKSNGRWYAISYHSQDDEIIQDSQVEEFKAEEQRTVTFQRMSLFGATKGILSFLAEVGGKTYIGWEKEVLVDRQPQPAAPLQPEPVQDRRGYFHRENESATWHGPQAIRNPLPQGSPPTARYTVTITDGPDGTPQAEFTLVELSY